MAIDNVDRIICEMVQQDGKISTQKIADATNLPTSTANDRVKRLVNQDLIEGYHAKLNYNKTGAGLACFVLVDMEFEGEDEAVAAICQHDEVMELHHISGAHSYMMKLRVGNMEAVQNFLSRHVKPLKAVVKTETIFALKSLKETSKVKIMDIE